MVEVTAHEDPTDSAPWAMQIVVNVPKADKPAASPMCEAAAIAALAVIDDDRAQEGGVWFDAVERWCSGRIRKLVRRARSAKFTAACESVPGVVVTHRDVEVFAALPAPVDAVPQELAKLQVSGLVLDEVGAPNPCTALPHLQVVINPELGLDVHPGKAAAQAAHAAQVAYMNATIAERDVWRSNEFSLSVEFCDTERFEEVSAAAAVLIHDAGFTVVEAGSLTAAAVWATM